MQGVITMLGQGVLTMLGQCFKMFKYDHVMNYSNGVTVIYNPPVTGNISVEIKNTSLAHQEVGQHTLIFIRTLNSIFVKYSNLSIDCW
jgi:hypothetical protein